MMGSAYSTRSLEDARKDFRRQANRRAMKMALVILGPAILVVILAAVIG